MARIKHFKRIIPVIIPVVLLAAGWFGVRALQTRNSSRATIDPQSTPVLRGEANEMVQAEGRVEANQSAQLIWWTSGTVAQVTVTPGDTVAAGEELATLEKTSLPQHVILAQADLISAQRELDDLLHSKTQRAEALKAVDEAQQALEDAVNDEAERAQALEAVAQAQKAIEEAELNLAIIVKQPSQQAIEQAYANLVLAENVWERTRAQHEKVQRQLHKPKSNYQFFESKALYRNILKSLDLKLARDQQTYEQALERYNRLLEPVDPFDRMVAEGNLKLAQAQLAQAKREYERVKDGPTAGEIAVLEAELADAQREWQRWKEGADPAEITTAQAGLAAAQAVLAQGHLRAPFDGVVTEVAISAGDQVSAGTPAIRVDDLSPLLAILQVSEIDINLVRVGQTAILKFDSAPSAEYHGRVIEVPLVGEEVGGAVSFAVKVAILDSDEKIKPGMTTVAEIIVNNIE